MISQGGRYPFIIPKLLSGKQVGRRKDQQRPFDLKKAYLLLKLCGEEGMYVIMEIHHPKPGMENALLETLERQSS
jgi:hypothetical protein